MVQLKGKRTDRRGKADAISIPHGTIKRLMLLNLLIIIFVFQYLMVQLKEPAPAPGSSTE